MLIEVTYEKSERLRYLSHLEVMRAFERAVRRARIPVAYSSGFNPRPRISYVAALGVGVSGEAERACLKLAEHMTAADVEHRMRESMPDGLCIHGAVALPGRSKADSAATRQAEYVVSLNAPRPERAEMEQRIEALMARDEIAVTRRKKDRVKILDIRPQLLGLEMVDDSRLRMLLEVGEGGQARPVEVLRELGLAQEGEPIPWIHRTGLFGAREAARSLQRRR